MKKHKNAWQVILLLVLILFLSGKMAIGNVVGKARRISASMPDLSNVQDGRYLGEYAIAPVSVQVEVVVTDHQISDITVARHDNGLGRAAEGIVGDIIQEQSLDIDGISGATVSSKCILKAVENAIENAKTGG